MIKIARNAIREVKDLKIDRYACYLIAQNADSRKKAVALAQTYFAVQTRKQKKDVKKKISASSKKIAGKRK